jgi:hypothetical protein
MAEKSQFFDLIDIYPSIKERNLFVLLVYHLEISQVALPLT